MDALDFFLRSRSDLELLGVLVLRDFGRSSAELDFLEVPEESSNSERFSQLLPDNPKIKKKRQCQKNAGDDASILALKPWEII